MPNSPAVIAFWHGEMLPIWRIFAKRNALGIVSQSNDGAILSYLLTQWKYKLVRGSSSKGGSNVIMEVLKDTTSSFYLMTPDGPRGPRHKSKAGAFVIAQRKQIPLYFAKCNIHCKKVLHRSWDKFEVPLPFTRVDVDFGSPIIIPQDLDKDGINKLLKTYSSNADD
jgi:lysophospholipid acyltransferase (LPLAT)-like uncharacterized protein